MELPFWVYATVLLVSMTALSAFLYQYLIPMAEHVKTVVDKKSLPNGQLAEVLRNVAQSGAQAMEKGLKEAKATASFLLDQTLLKEPSEAEHVEPEHFEQPEPKETRTLSDKSAVKPSRARDTFGILFHEAELLVKAIDKKEEVLTMRQMERMDILVDSLLFLEEEYRKIPQATEANEVIHYKLRAMIDDLKIIHQSTLPMWQEVSNY